MISGRSSLHSELDSIGLCWEIQSTQLHFQLHVTRPIPVIPWQSVWLRVLAILRGISNNMERNKPIATMISLPLAGFVWPDTMKSLIKESCSFCL